MKTDAAINNLAYFVATQMTAQKGLWLLIAKSKFLEADLYRLGVTSFLNLQ
jgi:hypothetical protein